MVCRLSDAPLPRALPIGSAGPLPGGVKGVGRPLDFAVFHPTTPIGHCILQVIPARVRFISYVPTLGPLTDVGSPRPDWIICGGQSGRKAIKMNEERRRHTR